LNIFKAELDRFLIDRGSGWEIKLDFIEWGARGQMVLTLALNSDNLKPMTWERAGGFKFPWRATDCKQNTGKKEFHLI